MRFVLPYSLEETRLRVMNLRHAGNLSIQKHKYLPNDRFVAAILSTLPRKSTRLHLEVNLIALSEHETLIEGKIKHRLIYYGFFPLIGFICSPFLVGLPNFIQQLAIGWGLIIANLIFQIRENILAKNKFPKEWEIALRQDYLFEILKK